MIEIDKIVPAQPTTIEIRYDLTVPGARFLIIAISQIVISTGLIMLVIDSR